MSDMAHRRQSDHASFKVSSSRLESASTSHEVFTAIEEIIVNLIGSEELAIFTVDESVETLTLAHSFGVDPLAFQDLRVGVGTIGRVASSGHAYIDAAASGGVEPLRLTAGIPLSNGDDVIGVVAVFQLLAQKSGLTDLDRELLEWLEIHGATALERATRTPEAR